MGVGGGVEQCVSLLECHVSVLTLLSSLLVLLLCIGLLETVLLSGQAGVYAHGTHGQVIRLPASQGHLRFITSCTHGLEANQEKAAYSENFHPARGGNCCGV